MEIVPFPLHTDVGPKKMFAVFRLAAKHSPDGIRLYLCSRVTELPDIRKKNPAVAAAGR